MMKKNLKLISVIVPVYNVEKYIGECLNSIINQSYKNLEIIIVNDGSSDDSFKICKEYAKKDNRIKLFSKKNGGVSSARNFALKQANGDFISFIDADDYLEVNAYEIMINNIKNYDLICFNWNKVYADYKEKCGIKKTKVLDFKSALELAVKTDNSYSGYLWNKLFLNKIIKENSIKFDENVSICEDLMFVINYIRKCSKINLITNTLYNYRMRKSSVSKKFNLDKFKTMFNIYDKVICVWNELNLKNIVYIEYEYLYTYYLYKKMFNKNGIYINKSLLKEYKKIIKCSEIKKKQKKDLSMSKNFNLLFRIKNRFFYNKKNIHIMFE